MDKYIAIFDAKNMNFFFSFKIFKIFKIFGHKKNAFNQIRIDLKCWIQICIETKCGSTIHGQVPGTIEVVPGA
jgi:hypothetical protein